MFVRLFVASYCFSLLLVTACDREQAGNAGQATPSASGRNALPQLANDPALERDRGGLPSGKSPGRKAPADPLKAESGDADTTAADNAAVAGNQGGETQKSDNSGANESAAGEMTDSGTAPSDLAVPEMGEQIFVADGALALNVPAAWKTAGAGAQFVEIEFAVPRGEDEAADGRITGMRSGGTLESNFSRWHGQFKQPDGSDSSEKAKTEELESSGLKIHLFDLSGTYLDGGPMQPNKTEREGYRMLAGIVEMDADQNYFWKFYGPQSLVDRHEAGFRAMLNSIKPVQ